MQSTIIPQITLFGLTAFNQVEGEDHNNMLPSGYTKKKYAQDNFLSCKKWFSGQQNKL